MFVLCKGTPCTFRLLTQPCKYAGKKRTRNTYIQDRDDNYTAQHKKAKFQNEKIKFNIWEYTVGNAEKYRTKVKREHPAKFPILLARDHLLSWSNEGEIVLDPFMGSGTTAIVARLSNRKYIGFDISEDYCKRARGYLKEVDEKVLKIIILLGLKKKRKA